MIFFCITYNGSTRSIAYYKQNLADATIQLIYSIKNATKIEVTLLILNRKIIHSYKLNVNENQLNIDSKNLTNGQYF